MSTASLLLLIVEILSVDGTTAALRADLTTGLRAGDEGTIFYVLEVGDRRKRIYLGPAAVTGVDELGASAISRSR